MRGCHQADHPPVKHKLTNLKIPADIWQYSFNVDLYPNFSHHIHKRCGLFMAEVSLVNCLILFFNLIKETNDEEQE